MSELEVDISWGWIRAIPVVASTDGMLLLSGPARVTGWSFREAGDPTGQEVEGQVVSPGAGATIAQIVPASGAVYSITWSVQLIGAAAAADQDNFGLFRGGTQLDTSLNPGAAGVYAQSQVTDNDLFGLTYAVKAIGAGTAGVTYAAQMSIAPISGAVAIAELQDGNQPLAEISLGPGGVDTRHFGPHGIVIMNQVKLHLITGNLTGALYAVYERL